MFSETLSQQGEGVSRVFDTDIVHDVSALRDMVQSGEYRIIVFDLVESSVEPISLQVVELIDPLETDVPIVVLAEINSLDDNVEIYDLGVDDLIGTHVHSEEVVARCKKAIYHNIAMSQLANQLSSATQAAKHAVEDKCNLGANVDFLLSINQCDNLDQLGQQFFASIQRYGLSCSLQMRSTLGTKNMEPTGLAKDLVSQLLSQLKDDGRFLDLGRRTIVNYERVSLLIKNMPEDDLEKYNTVKDNIFSLVQGINYHIMTLEDRFRLVQGEAALDYLVENSQLAMSTIKSGFQKLMTNMVANIDATTQEIQEKVPSLNLSQEDVVFFEQLSQECLLETGRLFDNGLELEEIFGSLGQSLDNALRFKNTLVEKSLNAKQDPTGENSIKKVDIH